MPLRHSLLLLVPVAALLGAHFPLPPAAITSVPRAQVPEGWHVGSTTPEHYVLEVDPQVAHGGRASGRLVQRESGSESIAGGVNQAIRAQEYRGKRIRLSGFVRAQDATWAMSWLRVEGPRGEGAYALALSNTADRPISGTADWQRFEHVLDVAPEAEALVFGVLTRGPGRIWVDDVAIEVVAPTVSTTDRMPSPQPMRESADAVREIRARWAGLPLRLVNGDFEQGAAK
jgi:hypothetical protein